MSEKNQERDSVPENRQRLCFVVDDETAICRMVTIALRNFGFDTEQFNDTASMLAGLERQMPDLMLLDVSLGDTDAIEAIRGLSRAKFGGIIHLMSGRDAVLLEDVRRIGQRYGLRMGPVLQKPFRVDALRRVVEASPVENAPPDGSGPPQGPKPRGPQVDLAEALDRDWVELWYQPKLGLNSGALVGAEGLSRIRHPEHGILFPGSFIPTASGEDLVKLAEFSVRSAIRDTIEFSAAGYTMQLAVNVPVQALVELPIGAIVRDCRAGEEPEWNGIVLEVTEDQVIRDIELAHEIATQLRIHRVDLAIDDFGSGYSSLARLKELPFAELKLDRSFVDNCGDDPTNAALCKTVVDLAHRFGSLAVAEGIEKPTDLAVIQSIGCDVVQGFLFAHAMPKEFLLARLLASGGGDFGRAITASANFNERAATA